MIDVEEGSGNVYADKPLKSGKSWLSLLETPGCPEFEPDRTPIASGEKFFAEYMADLEQNSLARP